MHSLFGCPCCHYSDGTLSPAAAKVIFKELPEKSVYFVTGGTDAWQVRLLGFGGL